MKGLRRFKRHKEFIANVGTIMSGRSIAAAIGLIATPVVARLFEPSDFGVAASFLAIAAIAATVASLRYESAIVLPKDETEALQLVALANRILPLFCMAFLVAVFLLEALGLEWKAFELLGNWVWVLPLCILLMGAQDIQESWLARQKSFGVISSSVVAETTMAAGSRIVFGAVAGSSVFGLLVGHLIGVVSRLLVQGRGGAQTLKATIGWIEWTTLISVARRYSDFARLNAPAGLIYSLGQNVPVLMFGALFSPAVAGFFAMANRLSRAPVQIVAMSVRRVFLQKAASIKNDGRSLRRPFTLTTLGLLAMGSVPCSAVWLYGQPLLSWLLGDRWFAAGRFLEIIAPWVLMAWVTAPCNPVYIVLRRQRKWLTLQIFTTVLRLSAFGVSYVLELGVERTLELFVYLAVIGYIVTITSTYRLIGMTTVASVREDDRWADPE